MTIANSPGLRLPEPSRADRNIARSSKGHFSISAVLGGEHGQMMQAESWMEFCNLLLLNASRKVVDLREQVRFRYGVNLEHAHVFDAVADLATGERIAFTVKPRVRLASGAFLDEMQEVAWWVERSGFASEVRLVTEADLDPILVRNATILASVRDPDPEADNGASTVASRLIGAASLRDLTLETEMEARGYRALLRLIRDGVLYQVQRELITPKTLVHKYGDQ